MFVFANKTPEVWENDVDYVASYASTMGGLLNYPIYYPLNAFFQQTGSSQALVDMHNTVSSKFPDPGKCFTSAFSPSARRVISLGTIGH
jgi:hypothetical protein